jgi:hypothetical protein
MRQVIQDILTSPKPKLQGRKFSKSWVNKKAGAAKNLLPFLVCKMP